MRQNKADGQKTISNHSPMWGGSTELTAQLMYRFGQLSPPRDPSSSNFNLTKLVIVGLTHGLPNLNESVTVVAVLTEGGYKDSAEKGSAVGKRRFSLTLRGISSHRSVAVSPMEFAEGQLKFPPDIVKYHFPEQPARGSAAPAVRSLTSALS